MRVCIINFVLLIFLIDNYPLVQGASTGAPTRKENLKNGLKHASFDDITNWKNEFPNCDQGINPNMSPINIISKDTDSETDFKALIVHSDFPAEDCLFLSLLYQQEDLEMEILNMYPAPNCNDQITYISGGGEGVNDKRYFKRAFFFFTKSPVDAQQSLHQLDGKTFDMEILMEFESETDKEVTNVHLMVEASDETPDNPVLRAIENALESLVAKIIEEASGTTNRSVEYKSFKEKCDKAERSYSEALSKHQDEGSAQGKALHDRLHELDSLIKDIKNTKDEDVLDLIKKAKDDNTTDPMQDKIKPLKEERQTQIEKLGELFALKKEDPESNKYADEIAKAKEEINTLTRKIRKLKRGKKSKISPTESLENVKDLLTFNKVGIPGEKADGMLFETPNAIYKERDEILEKVNELDKSRALYDQSCAEFVEFQKMPYVYVPIEGLLQISWLFSHYGGYYLYEGSSPIPMCENRKSSIVLETPLKISIEQLKLFQDLPSISGKNNSDGANGTAQIDKMIPILYQQSMNGVKHVTKNPVFLKDDGFHIKRSRENKARGKMAGREGLLPNDTDSGSSSVIFQIPLLQRVLFYCLIVVDIPNLIRQTCFSNTLFLKLAH